MEKIEKLLKEFRNNPRNINLLFDISNYYFDNDDYTSAIKFLNKILKIDPENEEAFLNLGIIYGKLALEDITLDEYWEDHTDEENLFENAIKNYLNCIEINPKNKTAYNNLAVIYDALDWNDKAKEMIEKSLEIDPNQKELKEMLDELEF